MSVYKPTPVGAGIIDQSGYSTSQTNSQYDLLTINSKYYNQYLGVNINFDFIKGDATKETAGWYSDYQLFINVGEPWLSRGGSHSQGAAAGIFDYALSSGAASDAVTMRIVLSPNP
jgi:hypothetical protein